MNRPAEFDEFADDYEAALEKGISLSGEDGAYFAQARVTWTARRLLQLGHHPSAALDFGCGTGSTTPLLLGLDGVESVVGTDVSRGLLDVARRDFASPGTAFIPLEEPLEEMFDLAYCNGVFHHIPPGGTRLGGHLCASVPAARGPLRVLGEQPVEPRDTTDHAADPVRP
ncbi:methyltransferase domain-containing protein [Conexibacter sp. W3-3-2]|uniref:class I SAM-dependent methyltransferase n=1 Tax=Conexibacter sp. W3-3-2 TaxID=2675227 RepID=UPI0012B8ABD6|nr:class I SAM-dependent methyltransferase [Conexibacter sp. W3-3-2]MTD46244.1 methyltransferase domain-containing protein [Conexibacter sp. W3-3-2]